MKLGWIVAVLLAVSTANANVVGGPKGGRMLENDAPRAEFFINAERKVELRFYDADLNPVAPGDQVVNVIANAPGGKANLDLQPQGDALVSTASLPEGDGYVIIVQVRANATAKPQNFRIIYHSEICGECNRAEYACICDHSEGDEHGHHGH